MFLMRRLLSFGEILWRRSSEGKLFFSLHRYGNHSVTNLGCLNDLLNLLYQLLVFLLLARFTILCYTCIRCNRSLVDLRCDLLMLLIGLNDSRQGRWYYLFFPMRLHWLIVETCTPAAWKSRVDRSCTPTLFCNWLRTFLNRLTSLCAEELGSWSIHCIAQRVTLHLLIGLFLWLERLNDQIFVHSYS
jgi:hypothetical protein